MHLIVVEHEAAASVGRLAPHLVEHRVTTVRPANGDPFPVVADRDDAGGEADNQVDGVIVLGGSMGAYEEFAHPWLIDEKCWIAQVVGAQVPLLGICLGSQLLADATGGRAYRAEGRLEAGVLNLHLTDAGQVDPVVAKAGPRVFAVHGDTFELPPDATLMARTDDYQQAFRIGSALGVQFHPETDADTAIDWAQSLVGPVLDRAGVTQSEFATQLRDAEDELASAAHNLFAAWLDEVDRRITTPGWVQAARARHTSQALTVVPIPEGLPVKIDFWFDPACPWCWLTSRWVETVVPKRDLEITWRSISLFFKNNPDPDHRLYEPTLWSRNLLRVVEAVREAGHEDRVGELYTRFGTHIHHEESIDFHVADDLEALGLDPALAAALDDETYDDAIRASMDAALDLTGEDVGTPLIAFDDTDGERVGLFGPVMSNVPTGDAAVEAWDAFVTLARTPGFWETKRSRSENPNLDSVPPGVRCEPPTAGSN